MPLGMSENAILGLIYHLYGTELVILGLSHAHQKRLNSPMTLETIQLQFLEGSTTSNNQLRVNKAAVTQGTNHLHRY
jgi:hypothetical protein